MLVVKNPPDNAGDRRDMGSISGLGRSPGEGQGNPLQCSCLEKPTDRGAWRATVHGVAKRWTWLKQLSMHGSMMWILSLSSCRLGTLLPGLKFWFWESKNNLNNHWASGKTKVRNWTYPTKLSILFGRTKRTQLIEWKIKRSRSFRPPQCRRQVIPEIKEKDPGGTGLPSSQVTWNNPGFWGLSGHNHE